MTTIPPDPNDPYGANSYEMVLSYDLDWNADESIQYQLVPMVQSSGVWEEDTTRALEFTATGETFEVEIDLR